MDHLEDTGITATWELNGEVAELRLEGELDAHSSPTIEPLLTELVAAGARSLILDMAGVDFVDSSGLRTLIRARQQFDGPDPVRIRRPQASTARLLEITGLTDQFPVEP